MHSKGNILRHSGLRHTSLRHTGLRHTGTKHIKALVSACALPSSRSQRSTQPSQSKRLPLSPPPLSPLSQPPLSGATPEVGRSCNYLGSGRLQSNRPRHRWEPQAIGISSPETGELAIIRRVTGSHRHGLPPTQGNQFSGAPVLFDLGRPAGGRFITSPTTESYANAGQNQECGGTRKLSPPIATTPAPSTVPSPAPYKI